MGSALPKARGPQTACWLGWETGVKRSGTTKVPSSDEPTNLPQTHPSPQTENEARLGVLNEKTSDRLEVKPQSPLNLARRTVP